MFSETAPYKLLNIYLIHIFFVNLPPGLVLGKSRSVWHHSDILFHLEVHHVSSKSEKRPANHVDFKVQKDE